MKNFFLTLFFLLFSGSAFSADVTTETLNKTKRQRREFIYSQELVKIDAGKSIEYNR